MSLNEVKSEAQPLGAELFRYAMRPLTQWVCGLLLGAAFVLGLVSPFINPRNPSQFQFFTTVPLLLAVPFLIAARARLSVHEHGVVGVRLFGTQAVRYSELLGFQFEMTGADNGSFSFGTQVKLTFIPCSGGSVITHTHVYWIERTASLDAARQELTERITPHLLEHVRQGESVPWGSKVRFTPRGLVVEEFSLFGKGAERLIPYHANLRLSSSRGIYNLYLEGKERRLAGFTTAALNFHPGLAMLRTLCADAEASRPPRSTPGRVLVK